MCPLSLLDEIVSDVRKVALETSTQIPIIAQYRDLDFQIDSQTLAQKHLTAGQFIFLSDEEHEDRPNFFKISISEIAENIEEGDRILVDYGKLVLEVVKTTAELRTRSSGDSVEEAQEKPDYSTTRMRSHSQDAFKSSKEDQIEDEEDDPFLLVRSNSFLFECTPKRKSRPRVRYQHSPEKSPGTIIESDLQTRYFQSTPDIKQLAAQQELQDAWSKTPELAPEDDSRLNLRQQTSVVRLTQIKSEQINLQSGNLLRVQSSTSENTGTSWQTDEFDVSSRSLILCRVLNDYTWIGSVLSLLIKMPQKNIFDISFMLPEEYEFVNWVKQRRIEFVIIKDVENSQVRQMLSKLFSTYYYPKLISGFMTKSAIKQMDTVIDNSFALLFGRGRLSIQLDLATVLSLQKKIIQKCNFAGKHIIVSTQMLDSMIVNQQPTSAEVADITNAVLDGASSIMLLQETSQSQHPVLVVETLSRIIQEAELFAFQTGKICPILRQVDPLIDENKINAACHAAVQYVNAGLAKLILIATHNGYGAGQFAKYNPPCAILVVSDIECTVNQINIAKGCIPFYMGTIISAKDAYERVLQKAKKLGYVKEGDKVACVSSHKGLRTEVPSSVSILKVK